MGSHTSTKVVDIPNQNHLLLQLAASIMLGTDLVVHVQQLLQRFALGRHDEADDVHEQLRHRIAVEHDCQDALHRLLLGLVGALFQLVLEVLQRRLVGRVVLVDQAVCIVEESRHC